MFKDFPDHGFVLLREGTHLEVKKIVYKEHGIFGTEDHTSGKRIVFLPYTSIIRIDFPDEK